MALFLNAMNAVKAGQPEKIDDALRALDLSDINPIIRRERGIDLAWTLLEVLDRTRLVKLNRIPDTQNGAPYRFEEYREGPVQISQTTEGNWLFDRGTMERIPKILDSLHGKQSVVTSSPDRSYLPWHIRFREGLSAPLREPTFIIENWQWIGILTAIVLGLLLDKLVTLGLRVVVKKRQALSENAYYREVSPDILRPIGLIALAFVWWSGISLLGLPEGAMLMMLVAVKFIAGVSGVWATYRLVDLLAAHLIKHAEETESKLDDALVPLIPKSLKIFITVVGFVFVADNLDIDISSLLAGLGLGGLAFALAAKDMVQNLFGSVTVLLDRTFSVGDWIVVDTIEGSVEQIGFRSTRVRTFYNSLITVPNSKFITAQVDNMGARTYRRFSSKVLLNYETPPDRIEAFCEGVRELVRLHPYMRKDYYHVYLNGFGESALEILIYVFWETPDWGTELRERHRFLLDIKRLAARLDVAFALPSRTLHVQRQGEPQGREPEIATEDASLMGKEHAVEIVSQTTGLGTSPPPVRY